MKLVMLGITFLLAFVFSANSLTADTYNCGRIKDNWPPQIPKSTGTTCKLNVNASSPQEAFDLCTSRAEDGKNCCEDNVVHKNIKGLGIVKGNEVTHIPCPGK
ncbi:hypothetical protein LPTSP4_16070 [Leptospira ryugenii]|uniref:Lipoprotein n=1 Tax=Leptospira ryugenii TaxID=1917863 RepID=A0A2P2DZN7_9LEPT|nr:hypothetical protein [Leptospira ryugenii]GBF50083.1 hypothetical protein LPTSP4_16070 [Leptospira ryugenii]